MTLYIDLYFLLNFFLDLLALTLCRRLLGYRKRRFRTLLASLIGAVYAIATLGFSSPLAVLLHIAFGVLMLLIACGYGNLRRFLRLLLLFFGICFLLGGAITALGRGISVFRASGSKGHLTLTVVLAAALLGALVCLFCARVNPALPDRRTFSVSLAAADRRLSFQGYADTGNMLREPMENTPVILANAALSRKIYALFTDAPPPVSSDPDPQQYSGMPLRLVPCDTVGGKVVLAALKFPDALVEGETRAVCIALDFSRNSDYCGYEALVPAGIL